MTRIYLIRHAEAEGNLYRIAHGQYDSLITPRGYRQIEALKNRFASIPVDAVYSSDLFRTKTTARAICEPKGLPLTTRPDLREILMGTWEDVRWVDLAREHNEMLRNFGRHMDIWRAPGAETAQEVQERMLRAVREIAAAHPGETVAVFSHGMALRLLLCAVEGYPLSEFYKTRNGDNTAVSCIEADGDTLRLLFRDDNSHLTEAGLSVFNEQAWWKDQGRSSEPGYYFRPFDLQNERDVYLAWLGEYLGAEGAEAMWKKALAAAAENPLAVQLALEEDESAGLVQFGAVCGEVGCIDALYTLPHLRRRGYGVQLLGQAVQYFRPLGAKRLRACCPRENREALRFLASCGMRATGEEGESVVCELDIGYGEHTPQPLKLIEERL